MKKTKSSAQLKALARGQLSGQYRTLIPIMLFVQVLTLFLAMTSPSVSLFSIPGLLIFVVSNYVLTLFLSLFRVGELYLFLNLSCRKPIRFGDIFYGLRTCPWKIIGIQAIVSLIQTGLSFLPSLAALTLALTDNWKLLPVVIAAIVICLPLSVFFSLQYSQSFYVMLDFPEFSVLECLQYSSKIMKGNKARKFYLELSFLPLNFIAWFSCCIGNLFLDPYIFATNTNFYLDLIQNPHSDSH